MNRLAEAAFPPLVAKGDFYPLLVGC